MIAMMPDGGATTTETASDLPEITLPPGSYEGECKPGDRMAMEGDVVSVDDNGAHVKIASATMGEEPEMAEPPAEELSPAVKAAVGA